jgi:hypothetical protein
MKSADLAELVRSRIVEVVSRETGEPADLLKVG